MKSPRGLRANAEDIAALQLISERTEQGVSALIRSRLIAMGLLNANLEITHAGYMMLRRRLRIPVRKRIQA